jgi:hypothetical protein
MDRKVKYEAQALAIAMVVLVVSSLIAISVYSRTMKDKGLTLEERSSAEALEVSDVLIDRLTQFSMNIVIDEILAMDLVEEGTEYPYDTGIVLKENNNGDSNITELFRSESLQILNESQSLSDLLSPLCPTDKGGEYQITLKEADEDTYYEIKPGNVWSLPAKNLIQQDGCNVDIRLAVRGDTRAGFTLMKIYCSYDAEGNVVGCKEYDFGGMGDEYSPENDDILNYCFSDDGIECNNVNFEDNNNWIRYNPNEVGEGENLIDIPLPSSVVGEPVEEPLIVPPPTDPVQGVSDENLKKQNIFDKIVDLFKTKKVSAQPAPPSPEPLEGDYVLSEIRIKAVGGTIGVSYILPEQCLTGLRMFQLRATANCAGIYRGKEVLIPEQKWHNTIFDYVVFNGEGSL